MDEGGGYYKMLGMYGQQDMLRAVEGISLKVIGGLGWPVERVRGFIPDVKGELGGTEVHCYVKM